MRVSNVPTVASNALTGVALGAAGADVYPWRNFALAAPALVLLYIAGMATNDIVDASTDLVERPARPIPSGRVGRAAAGWFAMVATVLALALLATADWRAGVAGAGLALCSLAYNLTHRASPAAVVLMGGCRVLAVVAALLAVGPPREILPAALVGAILWVYIVMISVVARSEAGSRNRVRTVVAMICAISLLDAAFLGAMGWWTQAGVAVLCFLLATLAQRRILGS
jgi:4-hydroxybenzoate polyprenyltransferase